MTTTYEPNPYEPPQARCEAVIPAAGEDGSRGFRTRFLPQWLLAASISLLVPAMFYRNGLRRPLYLPCFMAKPKLFWPYLLSLLEPDSPLARAIRDARLAE